MNSNNITKRNILLSNILRNYLPGVVTGVTLTFLVSKIKRWWLKKKQLSQRRESIESNKYLDMNAEESKLEREQLKRNFEFFGEEGMKKIKNSFVCVVGIGGVGSHVVMTLIRSGVKRIRVVDYDIVTLSSLNRHAFAMRQDVGKLKVRVVKEYAKKINPNIEIESVDDAFIYKYADRYILQGNPDYVVDCIDDLEAKCELMKFCQDNKLRVISSMGAGGKCDPSALRVTDFHLVQGDKLAKRLRYLYKKKFGTQIPNFKTVFSVEKSSKNLSELEEHQKENPEIYRINENERVRSLPVFASIPAIFGQGLASIVLCDLAGMSIHTATSEEEKTATKEDMIGNVSIKKLYEEFKSSLNLSDQMIAQTENANFELFLEDFKRIAKQFNFVSSVSGKLGNKTKFVKWNPTLPPAIDNLVLLSKSEANKHFTLKNEEDLKNCYGEEIYNKVTQNLRSLK